MNKDQDQFNMIRMMVYAKLTREAMSKLVKERVPYSTELVVSMVEEEEARLVKNN